MNIATIEMDKTEAHTLMMEYKDHIKANNSPEYRAIMKAYAALAKGESVIHLSQALASGGTIEKTINEWSHQRQAQANVIYTIPRLACIAADATVSLLNIDNDGTVSYATHRWARAKADSVRTSYKIEDAKACYQKFGALVPLIPPKLLPKYALSNYHIIWEAEWQEANKVLPAPIDPILVKHLEGELYVVLAAWDLTAVERAVLAGRSVDLR